MSNTNDIFLGIWNMDTCSFPHFSSGLATVTKENEQINVHTKLQLSSGVWIDGGVAVINEEGRYKCPKSGGWHDMKVTEIDGSKNKLEITEYGPDGKPVVTVWFKQE